MRSPSPTHHSQSEGALADVLGDQGSAASGRLAPVLLLGLGNDIITDDAIGLLIVRRLEPRFRNHPSVELRETMEMGLALLDFMVGRRAVVIVDSIQTARAAPGFLHEIHDADLRQIGRRTPHFLGVGETLALGQRLGLAMPEQVKILAIEVEDPFTLGTELTPALRSTLPALVDRVEAVVRAIIPTQAGL